MKETMVFRNLEYRELISKAELEKRIKELATQLDKDYAGKDLVIVCVLKGAIHFVSDLTRNMKNDLVYDFLEISSYAGGTTSSGKVTVKKDFSTNIEGKHVLVVEDIVDTGITLDFLIPYIKERNVASVKVCTLIDKPSRRVKDVPADYVGFAIEDTFIIGYGLDYDEYLRNLDFIAEAINVK